ncbi:cell division protein FtsB [Nocardiopsis arvandica]|uniref:Cell division protein FtsB n=2 Tax=Nocardiopsis sinuspersici TaxID=501010 RepID=A0A7Y9XDB7_9ACTN|nr:cell division protein FtsB [Nocardiopsis sinuspersici]
MSRESEQQPSKAKKATKADRPGHDPARRTGPVGTGTGRTPGVRPMLTSRAAILALVVCVIALSLAYPLREYIAQRTHIDQLQEEQARMEETVRELRRREELLSQDSYVEREARVRLHYQYPGETTYIVDRPGTEEGAEADTEPSEPWFAALWRSVEEADSPPPDDGL